MNRDLRLVSCSLLFWGIGEGLFLYLLPLYLEELGASPLQIGVIIGLGSLVMTLVHLPAGLLADRLGSKQIMVASWAVGLLAAWIMFLTRSLPVFFAALLLYYSQAFIMAPLSSYVSADRGGWTTARALTTVWAGYNLGMVVGPPLGGRLAEAFGLRMLFGLATIFFVIATILMALIRKQPVEARPVSFRYRGLLANAPFLSLLALIFCGIFSMYLGLPLTPNYLRSVQGVSISTLGVFGALTATGSILLNLSLGRLRGRTAFLIAQAAMAFAFGMLWLGTGLAWFAMASLLSGALRTCHFLATAQVDAFVPRSEAGLAFGIAEMVMFGAMALAAPLAGKLYGLAPHLPYPASLALLAAIWLLTWRCMPRPAPRSDPLPAPAQPGLDQADEGAGV